MSLVTVHTSMELLSVLIHCVSNSIGIFCNALLIILIILKTPSSLRVYSLLLLNSAITDLVACLSAGFVMQSYRYYVLLHSVPKAGIVLFIILALYSVSFFMMVMFAFFAEGDPRTMALIIQRNHPDYDLRGATVSGNESVYEVWTMAMILYMTVPWVPVYILILYFRYKVNHVLEGRSVLLREETKDVHRQLVKSIIPAFFAVGISAYIIGQLKIYQSPFLEELVFQSMGFIAILSPVVTLVHFRLYRRTIIQWFFGCCGCFCNSISITPFTPWKEAPTIDIQHVKTIQKSTSVSAH